MNLPPLLSFNPELQRSLWLELTPSRLLWMAVALIVLIGGVYAQWGTLPLEGTVRWTILGLIVVWGSRLAGDSLSEEVADKTWDVQRLSAQSATSLILGKLIGGTAYAWVGAMPCFIVYASVFPDRAGQLPDLALTGILAQTTSLFVAFVRNRFGLRSRRLGSIATQAAGCGLAYVFNGFSAAGQSHAISATYWDLDVAWQNAFSWFGATIPLLNFTRIVAVLISVWMVIGSIRLARRELGHRDGPSGWTLFSLFALVVIGGFHVASQRFSPTSVSWQGNVLRAACLLTYVAFLAGPISVAALRRLALRLERGQFLDAWRDIPGWSISLKLAFLAAIVFGASIPGYGFAALAIGGFLVRDTIAICAIRLRFARRSQSALFLYLIAMYAVLPFIVNRGFTNMYDADRHRLGSSLFFPASSAGTALEAAWPWAEAFVIFLICFNEFRRVSQRGNTPEDMMGPSTPA